MAVYVSIKTALKAAADSKNEIESIGTVSVSSSELAVCDSYAFGSAKAMPLRIPNGNHPIYTYETEEGAQITVMVFNKNAVAMWSEVAYTFEIFYRGGAAVFDPVCQDLLETDTVSNTYDEAQDHVELCYDLEREADKQDGEGDSTMVVFTGAEDDMGYVVYAGYDAQSNIARLAFVCEDILTDYFD